MNPLVSIVIITRNRPEELDATLRNVIAQEYDRTEIILLDNGSDGNDRRAVESVVRAYGDSVRYLSSDQNLGVSGGRSKVLALATGEYIIEIDDDAEFAGRQAITRSVEYMEANPRVGVLAFRITNYYTNKIERVEFPFRDKKRKPTQRGPCAWFIGAGHCFRRAIIDEVGVYRDFFPWGSEEQDLSMRVLDAGFSIIYYPEVNVLHKKSPLARIDSRSKFAAIALKNRTKFALLNLPLLNAVSHFVIRGVQAMLKARDPTIMIRALWYLGLEWRYIRAERRVICRVTRRKIRTLGGPLYY